MNITFSGYDSHWCFLLRNFLCSNAPVLGIMVLWCMFKKLALSLRFVIILGMLTACNPQSILHPKENESKAKTTENTQNHNQNTPIGAPVALPPQYAGTPLNPGKSGVKHMPNGLPALSPMKGIKAETLFAENIKDTGDRFNRVENAVVDLRKEFEAYKPSIVRLAAVESDIQNLIKELEVLLQETPTPQPSQTVSSDHLPPKNSEISALPKQAPPLAATNTATSQPPPPVAAKKQKRPPDRIQKSISGKVAQNLRVGEHADKVRIVIDTSKKFAHTIDIDNDEKLIIVEIPEAEWKGSTEKSFPASKILDSYSVEQTNNGKGSMIIIALKKNTSVIKQSTLSPDKTSPYHRIYFDLKP